MSKRDHSVQRYQLTGKRAALREHIAAARGEAAVALDAELLNKPDMDPQVPRLLKLAIADYNERYPKNRIRYPYQWLTRSPNKGAFSGLVGALGDIYCRFCGDLIVQAVKRPMSVYAELIALHGDSPVANHVIPCQLSSLAGLRVPPRPGTRQLPLEVRP